MHPVKEPVDLGEEFKTAADYLSGWILQARLYRPADAFGARYRFGQDRRTQNSLARSRPGLCYKVQAGDATRNTKPKSTMYVPTHALLD